MVATYGATLSTCQKKPVEAFVLWNEQIIFSKVFFTVLKHDERRRSGRKILTQDFEHLPSEAALVYNLKCADYVSIACGSLDRLHEAFATVDLDKAEKMNVKERIPHVETASLPTVDRKIIRTDQMQRRISAAAKSRAPHVRS